MPTRLQCLVCSGVLRRIAGCSRAMGVALTLACSGTGPDRVGSMHAGVLLTSEANPSRAARVSPLELVRALPIERWDNFQPSGLLWHQGKLLTVSDKHDGQIFELVIEQERVSVRDYLRFELPEGIDKFDFEGLASDARGGFLIACEAPLRVLHVTAERRVAWLTPSLASFGRPHGLFQLENASIEGVARLTDGHLMLAAERSDRGLVELSAPFDVRRVWVYNLESTRFPMGDTRQPDFSDLATHQGSLFAVLRNAHLIVRLERSPLGWSEARAWAYRGVETDARYAYENPKYGLAEGLAIDDEFLYLVVDNNGEQRLLGKDDVRPQLWVFQRPSE